MSSHIIQGVWDDLVARNDLHGRMVRVIILGAERDEGKGARDNQWVNRLRAWADSHEPIGHVVDDSRERIYSGTLDDRR